MTWQMVLVLVIAGVILIGLIILSCLLYRAKKKEKELLVKIISWQSLSEVYHLQLKRLISHIKNKELSDDEAYKKWLVGLANWIDDTRSDPSKPEES